MTRDVPDILKKIIERKFAEIDERQAEHSLHELQSRAGELEKCRGFSSAIHQNLSAGKVAVIAEIKKASPSKGVIRSPFEPSAIAQSYEKAGASCLSVLTDQDFFQGSTEALRSARAACALPVIRKDFIVHPYQVFEARVMGADCVLLIAAALDDASLRELYEQSVALGMDVLVEVHDEEELQRSLALQPMLLGINNRDLRTFDVSLDTTEALLGAIPESSTVVTESGILNRTDVQRMRRAGVHAFLVGEAFMRAQDPGKALEEMFAEDIAT
ncbi:MAG: indole-3-glycerol phosphate synthase TrpC [Granulosicoccus sp.]|nr:indole-3-glycerol phosphate synthase TrpC [Granulosicoccus sp.]